MHRVILPQCWREGTSTLPANGHLWEQTSGGLWKTCPMAGLEFVTLVIERYDPAIEFFVERLGFELVEDSPSLTHDGRPKRWVVVRPPGGEAGLLLAHADGEDQASIVGRQVASRVGFFLRVDDFDHAYSRMTSGGVEFVVAPRTESYGKVAV